MDAYRFACMGLAKGLRFHRRCVALALHAMALHLASPPAAQALFQLQRAVQLLAPGLAEQDQHKFCGDLGISAGVVAFFHL